MASANLTVKLNVQIVIDDKTARILEAAGWRPPLPDGWVADDQQHGTKAEDQRLREHARLVRAHVAQEIAKDLASQADKKALSASDARFAAHVARRHIKPPQEPSPPADGLFCHRCPHPRVQHGHPAGCAVCACDIAEWINPADVGG